MVSYLHLIYNIEFGKKQQCISQVPHEMEDQIPGDEHLQEQGKKMHSQMKMLTLC